ncbi:PorT family protein [Lutibacter sp. A80]|uniref:PorT family protein n=1 Tax=Lutibacter sp. A80 TaxID=2918453 RepID=UPI001F067D29|nr:PorT family protein [Lutibacter sp. A80]UMB59666.1 PorT family protein [Lutibacter sp. A80]
MKKQFLLIVITLFYLSSYSQISFKKGYFIKNSGEKIECFIKNIDWKNNPSHFNYKLSKNDNQKEATIEVVKEFGIYNIAKYQRYTVDIDMSNESINSLNQDRSPNYKKETLFLKVLIEGNADLFFYEKKNLKRYFYKTDTINIQQLIYKSYLTSSGQIAKNNTYIYQLRANLKCQNISIKDTEHLDYRTNKLVDFFIKYNKCTNSEFVNYNTKQKKDLYNLTIRPGLNISSLTLRGDYTKVKDANFDNKIGFRIGIENELILPFNKNKWAIIIEPTYQYFKSETSTISFGTKQSVKIDYNSIELPIGVRHYMFLNKNSKLFINTSWVVDFNFGSYLDYEFSKDINTSSPNSNFAIGAGYSTKKYSAEIRYYTNRNLLEKMTNDAYYKSLSIIFGYSIF